LGDTTPRKVDVRIIAATNRDLKDAVRQGLFREDLYYRLAVVPIELPPLRDRRDDILALAQHFVRKYNEENGRQVSDQFAPDVLSLLETYPWPGNVRELENVIERAVVITPGTEVTRECLPADVRDPQAANAARQTFTDGVPDISRGVNFYDEVRRFEIGIIRSALEQTGGHQSRAARLLGMNATTLNSKIKTYNIQWRP
jgi:DNA-binding NtrC family response regulator